ncbi:membrane-associated protein, putative, partial [Bodo saltans]
MIRIPIKLAVALLLFAVCMMTCLFSQVPAVLYLQSDAMHFVAQASTSITDQVDFDVSQRLVRIETACGVLQRASRSIAGDRSIGSQNSDDVLFNVPRMIDWLGDVVTDMDVGAGLVYDDENETIVYIDGRITSNATGPKLPGYVHVVLSHPEYIDIGQFNMKTHNPPPTSGASTTTTTGWIRLDASLWLEFFARLRNAVKHSDSAPRLQWSRLSPSNSGRQQESIFVYGGAVSHDPLESSSSSGPSASTSAVKPQQHAFFMLRGSWLSKYFLNVTVSATGAAVLVDTVSRAFVAGNIVDPTGTLLSNGEASLVQTADLHDARIAPILSAVVIKSSIGATTCVDELMKCDTPCSYVYWAHSNTLELASHDDEHRGMFAFLYHGFVRVRVVSVNRRYYHMTTGGVNIRTVDEEREMLDLRLIVTVPSVDIIGPFMDAMHRYLLLSVGIASLICSLIALCVTVAFRGLTDAEGELLKMCSVFHRRLDNGYDEGAWPLDVASAPVSRSASTTNKRSMFAELNSLLQSIDALSRELCILRAYTPLSCGHTAGIVGDDAAAAKGEREHSESRITSTIRSTTRDDSRALCGERNESECGVPYDVACGMMWNACVTTVVVRLCPAQPFSRHTAQEQVTSEHCRINRILSILVNCTMHIAGCSIDVFAGDSMIIHFNARERCSKHARVAVNMIHDFMKTNCQSRNSLQEKELASQQHLTPSDHRSPLPKSTLPASKDSRFTLEDGGSLGGEGKPLVYFGVASTLSLCGFMGPASHRTFTVVSVGEAQATLASRVARA